MCIILTLINCLYVTFLLRFNSFRSWAWTGAKSFTSVLPMVHWNHWIRLSTTDRRHWQTSLILRSATCATIGSTSCVKFSFTYSSLLLLIIVHAQESIDLKQK